jgi:hypothetical protein
MGTVRAIVVALALTAVIPSTAISQTLESLQTRCAQKTLAYNRDGIQIAEAMNDYCRGFLEGTFTIMERARLICPSTAEAPPDGTVLLSVLSTYVGDQKLKGVDAAEAVSRAYQRAYAWKAASMGDCHSHAAKSKAKER